MEDSSKNDPVSTLRQKQVMGSDSNGRRLEFAHHNGGSDVASCLVGERTTRRLSGSQSEEEGESELSSCEDSDYKESAESAGSDGEGNEFLPEVEPAVREEEPPQTMESTEAELILPPAKKRRKRRTNNDTKGDKKKERGKRKKSQKKKAGMRRNIKETSLKELNPETFSAHNEELERMMRIGQLDSLGTMELQHNGDSDESGLPQTVLSLLNATWDTEGGGGGVLDPLDSILGGPEEKAPKLDGVAAPLQRPPVATWGETSQSVANGEDSATRSHEEAHLQEGAATVGSTEQSVTEAEKVEDDVIVIDSDTEAEGHTQGAAVRPSSGASNLASLRKRYLGLDIAEMGGAKDPAKITINPTHSPDEPDIRLAPQVAMAAKPHQIGGIRFLYDNIIESLKRFDKSQGYGCILAHSMGLGKTLQAIGFTDLFLRTTPSKHVMIVVPVNTLMNWIAEFDRWMPEAKVGLKENSTHATNHTGNETDDDGANGVRRRNFKLFCLNDSAKTMAVRVSIIKNWREEGGVLLIGYEMYRMLAMSVPSIAGNKMATKKRRTKKKEVVSAASSVIDLDKNEKEMDELIAIQEALCSPGPDLVICDEGHRIRNESTNISHALKRIRTHRRIVMTGYPLQNNLVEYWCMVDFVRPNYLGDKKEFQALFERPIVNGQCVDSTPYDVDTMKRRSHVLHRLLQGFVLRCDHSVLKSSLPPKYEHVLYTRPSEVQMKLYNHAQEQAQTNNKNGTGINPIVAFSTFTKIWNHPDIFHQFTRDSKEAASFRDLDIPIPKEKDASPLIADWPADVDDYSPFHIENGSKFVLLMDMLDLSVALGEKVLIFSQSLQSLSLIERFLSARPIPYSKLSENGTIEYSSVRWKKDVNYFRLDGSSAMSERESMIDRFNSSSNTNCWLFLLSTRAGCLGVNLVAASRVVVMDVSWNPCHDAQAVCRVYRYGQQKPCHIYRLVSDGTMERKVYQRQISKQGMSDRIVDELNPERNLARSDIESLIEPPNPLPEPEDLSGEIGRFGFDPILMTMCYRMGNVLTKVPFEHESLLLDKVDDKLTEMEKMEAWKDFHTERDRSRRGQMYVSSFNSTSTASPTPNEQQPAKLSYAEAMAAIAAKQHEMAANLRMPAPSGPSGLGYRTQAVGPSQTGQRQLIPPPVCGAMAPSLSSTSSSSGSLWPQRTVQTYHPPSQPFSSYPNVHQHSTSIPRTNSFGTLPPPYLSAGPGASIGTGPGATMATGPGVSMATGLGASMGMGPGASMAHRSYSSTQGNMPGYNQFGFHGNNYHSQAQIPEIAMNGTTPQTAQPSTNYHGASNAPYPNHFSSIISLLDSDDSEGSPTHGLGKNSVHHGYVTNGVSSHPPVAHDASSFMGNQTASLGGMDAENALSQSDLNNIMALLDNIPTDPSEL